jgi:hypothetical protein
MIQPRDKNLFRSYDPVRFWSNLTVVERHNVTGAAPGTWSVTALNDGLTGLLTPGNGVILFRDNVQVMSGPITAIERGAKTSTVSGVSDTDWLNDGILFPDPTKAITAQPVAYDNRSGPAETVLLAYINADMGPAATADRQLAPLRVPTSQGRGTTVNISGRLEQLGTTVADIAESGSLHVEIVHMEDTSGPYLMVTVRSVTDRSANVQFGTTGAFVGGVVGSDWSYTLTRPTVTRAIVAGQGVGADRVFVQEIDSDAEALWGARIELLVDERDTTDNTQLAQYGTDALSSGANPVSVSFTITDSPDLVYRRDWFVGDIVGVGIDDISLTDVVREVTTTVQQQSGSQSETVSAVVGSRDSSAYVSRTNTQVAKALQQLQLLKAS